MNGKLAALDRAVADRLKLSAHGEEIVKAAQDAQAKINDVLLPAAEKAQADITMVSMSIGGDANQFDDDVAQAGFDPGAGVAGLRRSPGFVNLAGSFTDRAAVAPTSRASPP